MKLLSFVCKNYPSHYARCLEASFQVIYRSQNGLSTAQNINFLLISFLVIFMIMEFISHLVSCFPAIGGIILSRK